MRAEHWESVYRTKSERDVSWFEAVPEISLALVEAAGLSADTCVIDVGGGDSRLVDALVARGCRCLTVLDISSEALRRARHRIAEPSASVVQWIEADVTGDWSCAPVDIWHDRAVFHFLVEPEQRRRYVAHLQQTLKAGGAAVIATFALDGPEKCSGLPVARYSPETLAAELGSEFVLVESRRHAHVTPWGAAQSFQYSRFRRL